MSDWNLDARLEEANEVRELYTRACELSMPRSSSIERLYHSVNGDEVFGLAESYIMATSWYIAWWLSMNEVEFEISGGRVSWTMGGSSSGGYGFKNRPITLVEQIKEIIKKIEARQKKHGKGYDRD